MRDGHIFSGYGEAVVWYGGKYSKDGSTSSESRCSHGWDAAPLPESNTVTWIRKMRASDVIYHEYESMTELDMKADVGEWPLLG